LSLAVVRDLRERRAPASPEEIAVFETDVLAGFVLARASAGLADGTIASDIGHLDQLRTWFGKPLWGLEPSDADVYFGKVLRTAAKGTRLARAQALTTFFVFLELRHQVEIHALTGRVVACPIDELNKPRGRKQAALRIPPTEAEVTTLFTGWRGELVTCRKFAPTARNYVAAKLMSEVGLRVNEARSLDLADVKWELGRFGKLHVRAGKGARGSGPRERMVPLINGATGLCAGSSRTCGGISTTTTPDPPRRCSHRSARTPTEPRSGSVTTPCARAWPRPLPRTCRAGRTSSLRMSCGISAPASSICPVWTCSPSKSCSDTRGSRQL
jgi:integrase